MVLTKSNKIIHSEHMKRFFKLTWQKVLFAFILLLLLISLFIPVINLPPPSPYDDRLNQFPQSPITIAGFLLPLSQVFGNNLSPYPDYPLLPGLINFFQNFFPVLYNASTAVISSFSLNLLIFSPLFYIFIALAYFLSCFLIFLTVKTKKWSIKEILFTCLYFFLSKKIDFPVVINETKFL